MQIGRLHIGPSQTNEPDRRILACWLQCRGGGYWRWLVDWRRGWYGWRPRFGPSMDSGTRWRVGRRYGGWLYLPFVGTLAYSTQPPHP